MRLALILLASLMMFGCSKGFTDFERGTLSGHLTVRWISPDKFVFEPAEDGQSLTFVRSNGDSITPGRMYTDGGSIPRPMRAFRSYSPWGYAPAFIVHDWLFEMHQCSLPGHEKYTLDEAALVMGEIIRTMMDDLGERNDFTLVTMYEAVRSPIAARYWNDECDRPELSGAEAIAATNAGMSYEIEWPPRNGPR